MRRCFAEGLTCAVARKGSPEAGSLIIIVRVTDNALRVFVPPPGPAYDELGRRCWLALFGGRTQTQSDVDALITKQISIDPDMWIIDIDDPVGDGLLDVDTNP